MDEKEDGMHLANIEDQPLLVERRSSVSFERGSDERHGLTGV